MNEGKAMLSGKNIIHLAYHDWDQFPTQRLPLLASLFAKSNRVLWVDSIGARHPNPLSLRSNKRLVKRLLHLLTKGRGQGPRGLRQVDDNLFVYSPFAIPFIRYEAVRRFNARWLRPRLAMLAQHLDMTDPILWISLPTAVSLIGSLKEKLVVYECIDEYAAFSGASTALRQLEEELLRKADIVFVVSERLLEAKRRFNPRVFVIPNAADVAHFCRAMEPSQSSPTDLARVPRPIVGYIGGLYDRMDFPLLLQMCRAHQEWSVVLVGELEDQEAASSIEKIRKEVGNLYALGARPYATIPDYIREFSVCIIPHRLTAVTAHQSVIKLYEYLATGKPVVSTNLPDIRSFRQVVRIARDADDFIRGVVEAIDGKEVGDRTGRLMVARHHTWERRAEQMSSVVAEALANPRPPKSNGCG